MNKNQHQLPTGQAKKPVPGSGPSANGYSPKYTPPQEPTVIPPPKVETKVEVPSVLETTSLTDLVARVEANASIVYPSEKVKCTTAMQSSSSICHALIVAPKNPDSPSSRFKVLHKGPGVAGEKFNPKTKRKDAIVACLEEMERKVGKELLG